MKLSARELAAYVAQGLTDGEIAEIAGVGSTAIWEWRNEYGITWDTVCPHCGRLFERLSQHVSGCVYEAGNFERLRAFLHENSPNGVLLSFSAYKRAVKGPPFPAGSRMLETFDDWPNVAKVFGLRPPTYQRTRSRPLPYDKSSVWAELRVWFDGRKPPFVGDDWDTYVKGRKDLPSKATIRRRWGVTWEDIVEEFTDTDPFPVRHPIDEITEYKSRRIPAWVKDEAERLTAHIADEAERAREWFRLLGLPQPETVGEMGD